MTGAYRVVDLDAVLMQSRLADILALEALFYRDFGLNYSHELWNAEHFLLPRPGKWKLSKAAIAGDDRLIGFWIASHDGVEELRGHRGGTHPDWRGAGIWRVFYERIYADGQQLGLKTMSHTVSAFNPNAVRAWQALGFRILSGPALEQFRTQRGRDEERIEGDRLVTPQGFAYHALFQEIQ